MADSFGLRREPPGAAWLRRNWNQLRPFEFEWVAASEREIVAHSADLDLVMAVVRNAGLADQVTYAFVQEFVAGTRDERR